MAPSNAREALTHPSTWVGVALIAATFTMPLLLGIPEPEAQIAVTWAFLSGLFVERLAAM
ncbi:hypothetical protein [Halorubrum tropicale]|uniref:Uncharacterized protein n=1 Tax=Halorubrum tropicale TaxID=1765655 RepID=A0A0N0BP12_9EURY|nr:hypothetical protein [Halorubrum tropicale]KOX93270.1 hypothetical protein AMR74_16655 [Halorubrum tropicale]